MAMEDLLRIAERTEDLPDQALAQIAASGGGIESVIAASEMKARNDIRQDAQMMQQQAQPPVVDQLINMAMRQPMPPMGAPMPPQMQQPMGQPMPPQMGMQQPMPQPAPQPTPPQMAPDMAQLAQQMGVPAMNTGGLIRRFQTGTQGTIGGGQLDAFLAQQQLEEAGFTTEQFEGLTSQERMRVLRQIEDRKALEDVASYAAVPVAAATDAAYFIPRAIDAGLSELANTRVGKALGFSDTFDESSRQPFDASQQRLQDYRQTLRPVTSFEFEKALGVGEAPDVLAKRQGPAPFGRRPEELYERPAASTEGLLSRTPTLKEMLGPERFAEYQRQNAKTAEVQASKADGSIGPEAATTQQIDNQSQNTQSVGGVPVTAAQANILTADAAFIDPNQLGATGGTGSTGLYANLVGNNPYSSVESKVSGNLNNQMLKDLIDREDKYNKAIDTATQKMIDLEADLPTRENIKDRIKEQTKLGMAKAFFDAAGSGSPDFLSALAQGMGGAAGIMNKMTGEEQKDLHQHALQMFQLEREKANTAFKRQDQTLTKIQNARTYQQTVSQNNRDLSLRLAEMQQKYGQDARNFAFEVAKFNAEQAADFKDDQAANAKTFEELSQNYAGLDFEMKAPAKEHDLSLAVNGFANMKVERAQNLANKGVKAVVKDMADVAQQLTPQQQQLSPAEQERIIASQLIEQYRDGNNVGKLDVLRVFGDQLRGLYGSAGTPQYEQVLQSFATKYPYIDTNYITDNATPIY